MERSAVSPGKRVLGMNPMGPESYLREIKYSMSAWVLYWYTGFLPQFSQVNFQFKADLKCECDCERLFSSMCNLLRRQLE